VNPLFIAPLFNTTLGLFMVFGALFLELIGLIIIKTIVRLE
jgi:Flp pilus assembly protein TadB